MLSCSSSDPLLTAADQSRIMQDQMTGAAMAMPPDPNKAFKVTNRTLLCADTRFRMRLCYEGSSVFQSEWEALEIVEHKWALENVEDELMSRDLNFGNLFSGDIPSTRL